MSQQTTFTNPPEIPVIVGAYYELLSKESEIDTGTEPVLDELRYSAMIANRWTFYALPDVAKPSLEDSLKFERLLAQWHGERDATSSVAEMSMCDGYQKIIAMGEVAIPLIIFHLRSEGDEPDHWFWALRVLTEVNPVADEDRGNVVKMAQAWLGWAEAQGYAR